ncbi:hypothetical protein [Rhizobium sp. BR 362]|uniref:hypothetical protein n=1 Tax=Rhizobium sp. BR 362 TaxID=3040670 RepID=UPI002F3ED218
MSTATEPPKKLVYRVRDIVQGSATISGDYSIIFETTTDALEAIMLATFFLRGIENGRPGCNSDTDALMLITLATGWLAGTERKATIYEIEVA